MSIRTRVDHGGFSDRYARIHGPDKVAKTVTFIVTHQCNLRCTYCYEHHKSDKEMTFETAKKCVDLLFAEDARNNPLINENDASALILDFIGGEPLLKIDLISQIMDYFLTKAIELDHRWQTNYMITMSTNGVLGDNPKLQEFMNKYKGRFSLGVTIDGDKQAHDACRVDENGNGSYDKAIKLFRRAGNFNGERVTKYTIAPGNIDVFLDSVKHMVFEEGVDTINCNCVYEEGWNLEHAKKLYKALKAISDEVCTKDEELYISILDWDAGYHLPDTDTQNWCGGDGRMLAFDVDGTVLPCMRYSSMSIPNQPSYRIGDVDSGLIEREDDIARIKALRSITRQSQSTQECLDCPINAGCAWCTAYNYEITGSPNARVTYICCMHKARCLAQYYHHNKIHLRHPEHMPMKINIPKEWALEIIDEAEWDMLKRLENDALADVDISQLN